VPRVVAAAVDNTLLVSNSDSRRDWAWRRRCLQYEENIWGVV
jgi:hypothetical protein